MLRASSGAPSQSGHPKPGLAMAALLSFLLSAAPVAQAPRPEVAIKAEFVLRFHEFVEWPLGSPGRPLSLCLSPSHPLGQNVHASASVQPRGRPVVVRDLDEDDPVGSCNVLFVAPGDLELLQHAKDLPILTIGDQPNFCQRGGIINLLVVDGRVRFEIDLDRARRAGLKMHSQLLRLASKVYGGLQ